MAHQPDLGIHTYSIDPEWQLPEVLAFGWLSIDHSFEHIGTNQSVTQYIKQLKPSWFHMGFHECEFCSDIRATGNGQVRIKFDGITYVAPQMISHYIEHHNYTVPQVIQTGVLTRLTDESRLRKILRFDWNPIGVSDLPADEYDSYIAAIQQLLIAGCTLDQLQQHLYQVEIEQFHTQVDGRRRWFIDTAVLTDRSSRVATEIFKC